MPVSNQTRSRSLSRTRSGKTRSIETRSLGSKPDQRQKKRPSYKQRKTARPPKSKTQPDKATPEQPDLSRIPNTIQTPSKTIDPSEQKKSTDPDDAKVSDTQGQPSPLSEDTSIPMIYTNQGNAVFNNSLAQSQQSSSNQSTTIPKLRDITTLQGNNDTAQTT